MNLHTFYGVALDFSSMRVLENRDDLQMGFFITTVASAIYTSVALHTHTWQSGVINMVNKTRPCTIGLT